MYKDISENYLHLQGWMMTKLKLSGNELLAFGLIYGFTQDGVSVYHGSLNYLQTWLNVTRPTAIKALKSLVKKNYLIKHEIVENNVKHCTYQANIELIKIALKGGKDSLQGSKESLQGGSKESLQGGSKESLHNNTNLNNTKRERSARADFSNSKELKECNESIVNSINKYEAFDYVREYKPIEFEKRFKNKYAGKIQNKQEFVDRFNNQIVIEGHEFKTDKLLARLCNYAARWVSNQNKYDLQPQSERNSSSKIPMA